MSKNTRSHSHDMKYSKLGENKRYKKASFNNTYGVRYFYLNNRRDFNEFERWEIDRILWEKR